MAHALQVCPGVKVAKEELGKVRKDRDFNTKQKLSASSFCQQMGAKGLGD